MTESGAALSRLGLGTVQFGLDYGVTNRRGKVDAREITAILETAADVGLRVLDSAATYGDSERILGELYDVCRPFRIVTKTPPIRGDRITADGLATVRAALKESRDRLRRPCLDAVLVHHCGNLALPGGDELWAMLAKAKANGEIAKIGFSAYSPKEVANLLPRFIPDIVQIPLNLLDQSFPRGGLLATLKKGGVEIHARSLFLQGTLLVEPDALPQAVQHGRTAFDAVARFLKDHGLTRLQGCLGYGLSVPEVDCLVLGVTSQAEFAAILDAARAQPNRWPDASTLAVVDERIINPGKWPVSPR